MSSPFVKTVADVVRRIPKGTVLSYGEVAMLAGKPGAARAVVRALHALGDGEIPWWRVVRADRTLAEPVAKAQGKLLRQEGVTVEGRRVRTAKGRSEARD